MAIIQVCGNVGSVEYKVSPSGHPVLIVSVADKRWNFKEEKEETYWIRAVWFGDRAEKLANSVTKAKVISITGKEAYKLYDGKIDRSIEPFDHTILQFKTSEEPTTRQTSPSESNHTPDMSYPPTNEMPYL